MGHIHTKAGQIDQTVSAYIIRRDGDDTYIMLHTHKKLGMLLPVGGHVELHETPWGALAHELEEESGYSMSDLEVLQPSLRIGALKNLIVHPQPFVVQTHEAGSSHYHTDMGYIFVAQAHPARRVAEGESDDIRWLTRAGIVSLTDAQIWPGTRQSCVEIFDHFLDEWQPVATTEYSKSLEAAN